MLNITEIEVMEIEILQREVVVELYALRYALRIAYPYKIEDIEDIIEDLVWDLETCTSIMAVEAIRTKAKDLVTF